MRIASCILIIGLISCSSYKNLPGKYTRIGKDYKYSLMISGDSTFTLETQSIHARSGCKGGWKLHGDTLLLKCNEEPFPAQIASGYMNEREKRVIVSRNGLKLGTVIL